MCRGQDSPEISREATNPRSRCRTDGGAGEAIFSPGASEKASGHGSPSRATASCGALPHDSHPLPTAALPPEVEEAWPWPRRAALSFSSPRFCGGSTRPRAHSSPDGPPVEEALGGGVGSSSKKGFELGGETCGQLRGIRLCRCRTASPPPQSQELSAGQKPGRSGRWGCESAPSLRVHSHRDAW